MKKYVIILALVLFAAPSFSQNAEDIIEKFKDKITNNDSVHVNSWKLSGKIKAGQRENPFNYYFRKPDRYRMDRPIRGMKAVFVVRDTAAYRGYMERVYEITENERLEIIRMATFVDVLMTNFLRDSLDVSYSGEEEVNGEPAYVLEAVTLDGHKDKYYFSKKDYTLLKRIEQTYATGIPEETDVYFKDYKRVEGYLVPQTVEIYVDGNLSTVKFNLLDPHFPLTDGVFGNPY